MRNLLKVVKTYTYRSVENKLFGDVMKAIQSSITMSKRVKKGIIVYEEYVAVVDVGEGEGEITADVPVVTEKRRKKSQKGRRTRYS